MKVKVYQKIEDFKRQLHQQAKSAVCFRMAEAKDRQLLEKGFSRNIK